MQKMKWMIAGVFLFCVLSTPTLANGKDDIRDLSFFLHRLRTVDHLPILEPSHTAMASTWDRGGAIGDGKDFKRIEGNKNILLDVDGPGCIHRIFVGILGKDVAGTRIQIFLDHNSKPIFDLTVDEFFDDKNGPFPYPLVFHKTYPGMLFPIPFAKHCKIQLVNDEAKNWGQYWQVTYTNYPPHIKVRSMTWPLSEIEQAELKKVCETWLKAESTPPAKTRLSSKSSHKSNLSPGHPNTITLHNCGIIRQIWVGLPASVDFVRRVRLKIFWDGSNQPSVDVPLAYFFGLVDPERTQDSLFNSLLMGVTDPKAYIANTEAYCCIPMPFANGAKVCLENQSSDTLGYNSIRLDFEQIEKIPANWGRFHATWHIKRAVSNDSPRYGQKNRPAHMVLDREARGKYIGVLLHVAWPFKSWWGEGDWLIWTDENGWPPSYHGTGSEEYFNSGWGKFDRKAVSGYATIHPGEPTVYTFHLNDAFQFQKNIRIAVETVGYKDEMKLINENHPYWGSTAYYYANTVLPAHSCDAASVSFSDWGLLQNEPSSRQGP